MAPQNLVIAGVRVRDIAGGNRTFDTGDGSSYGFVPGERRILIPQPYQIDQAMKGSDGWYVLAEDQTDVMLLIPHRGNGADGHFWYGPFRIVGSQLVQVGTMEHYFQTSSSFEKFFDRAVPIVVATGLAAGVAGVAGFGPFAQAAPAATTATGTVKAGPLLTYGSPGSTLGESVVAFTDGQTVSYGFNGIQHAGSGLQPVTNTAYGGLSAGTVQGGLVPPAMNLPASAAIEGTATNFGVVNYSLAGQAASPFMRPDLLTPPGPVSTPNPVLPSGAGTINAAQRVAGAVQSSTDALRTVTTGAGAVAAAGSAIRNNNQSQVPGVQQRPGQLANQAESRTGTATGIMLAAIAGLAVYMIA